MSGRLIILGKKGYCPWNSRNLSRIRRDEAEHRKAQEREQEKQADKASASRLSSLKESGNEGEKHLKRFSLFEPEEEAKNNNLQGSKNKTCQEMRTSRKKDEKNCRYRSIEHQSIRKEDQQIEFYLKPPPTNTPLEKKEILRHRDKDPMKDFYKVQEAMQGISRQQIREIKETHCALQKKKRLSKRDRSSDDDCSSEGGKYAEGTKERHKKKKSRIREDARRHKHSKSSKSKSRKADRSTWNSTLSIKELRERRKKREEQERQRQDAFLSTSENFGSKYNNKERGQDK